MSNSNLPNIKSNCPPDSSSKTCPPALNNMNAQEACAQIKKAAEAADVAKACADAVQSLNPLSFLKSNASSSQTINNVLSTYMSTTDEVEQNSACDQSVIQSQTNSISGPSDACIASITSRMDPSDIGKYLSNTTIQNVMQQNSANAVNICRINLALKTLSKMDASIDNSAIQSALNTAKGMLSSSSSDQSSCTDISASMSACKYITQNQCCSSQIAQDQENLLSTGCTFGQVNNIMQTNNADAQNNCILSAQASLTTDMKSKIKNKVQQSATNKSEGLTMDFMLILIIIFCAIIGIPVFAGGYIGKKIFLYIGPILCIIGLVFIVMYVLSRKSDSVTYNSPYSNCIGTKGKTSEPGRSTFGEVKSNVDKYDVVGYDFFIDVGDKNGTPNDASTINPASIKDDQTGSVLYITVIPKDGAQCDSLDKKAMATVSYSKASANYKYLVIGIALIIAGFIMVCYGLYKQYQADQNAKKLLNKKKQLSNPIVKTISPIKSPVTDKPLSPIKSPVTDKPLSPTKSPVTDKPLSPTKSPITDKPLVKKITPINPILTKALIKTVLSKPHNTNEGIELSTIQK